MDFFGPFRDRQRNSRANANADIQAGIDSRNTMQRYTENPSASFDLRGTNEEMAQQAAQLSQAGVLTGQNIFGVGQDAQQYRGLLQDRLSGSDPVSQYMIEGRNRNLANVGRSLAGRGVAGGVAAASMNQAQREADTAINAQSFENQVRNQRELDTLTTKNQKVIGNALAAGSDRGLADDINTNAGQGVTLICTELKRQGLLPVEVQAADHAHGLKMWEQEPMMMAGYTDLAGRIVPKMQTSKFLTSIIAFFAIPWAYHIAGAWNIRGAFVNVVGKSLCRVWANYQVKKIEAKLCR